VIASPKNREDLVEHVCRRTKYTCSTCKSPMYALCFVLTSLIPEDCERDPDFDGKRACRNACERPIIARELYPDQVRREALASFDAAVASAAGLSTADAPAVRDSVTTVRDRSGAGQATGVDFVEGMEVAPGNKGGSSEVLSGKYFTAAGGIKWARIRGLDALVADSYNAVDVAHSKHGGKAVAREVVVKVLHGHKSLSADLKEALTVEQWFHGIDS
jgi:hypothetical protein